MTYRCCRVRRGPWGGALAFVLVLALALVAAGCRHGGFWKLPAQRENVLAENGSSEANPIGVPDGARDASGDSGNEGVSEGGPDNGGPLGRQAWVSIPAGTFQMGSDSSPYANEKPAHQVSVPSFEMLRGEVTVAQYRLCVDAGQCAPPQGTGIGEPNWNDPGYENHPVNFVNWQDAVDFCNWAGGRLPSEAEWEYAARSRSLNREFPWGDNSPTCEYAVMSAGGDGCSTSRTWPPCSKPAGNTAEGLCDMAGNLWEWVQDWAQVDYNGAPDDGSAWEPSGTERAMRGGSFVNNGDSLRGARRNGARPDIRLFALGMRCARTAR